MCGIFGVLAAKEAKIQPAELRSVLFLLHKLSESRGKESAGLHVFLPMERRAWTIKADIHATKLMKHEKYQKVLHQLVDGNRRATKAPLALLAHSRLVTNGTARKPENNQPVSYGDVTVIHNGIVVNVDDIWAQRTGLERFAEVDTEVIAASLDQGIKEGNSAAKATIDTYADIQGAASIAWVHEALSQVVLATNTGDLYLMVDEKRKIAIFASERFILSELRRKHFQNVADESIVGLCGKGVVLHLDNLAQDHFNLDGENAVEAKNGNRLDGMCEHDRQVVVSEYSPVVLAADADETLAVYDEDRLREQKRCSRCILPESFPFIHFDQDGVCNYCHGYQPKYKDIDPKKAQIEFLSSIEHYRSAGAGPNVLVPFSGGRDSCYGLHLIKQEFGFNPITFTYDWGMVTDLARRNIARMCGQLGVQNILVSADIKTKRENIRKNVSAWLKKPALGMVPLFMAGDKHFFSIVNQLKKQTGIRLDLWSANPLENTDFKSGFCGVAPDFDKERLDYLSWGRKAKMAAYYATNFIQTPSYLNSSLLDTAGAFFAYYAEPRRDFYFMFDHMVWDERTVDDVILNTYDFERSPDSPSTWRIGDGTAPFYNYIYLTACGFTEFDTFRSNQIREGMLSREDALRLVLSENRPRVASLRWYLDTVGLDFNSTLRRVNELRA